VPVSLPFHLCVRFLVSWIEYLLEPWRYDGDEAFSSFVLDVASISTHARGAHGRIPATTESEISDEDEERKQDRTI
jgi:hypothetical protein